MNIEFKINGNEMYLSLEGRLDTITSVEFDDFSKANIKTDMTVIMDCEKLEYVSSAGLRVLLSAHKKVGGALTLKNVCELVMEVFDMTGFSDILVIE